MDPVCYERCMTDEKVRVSRARYFARLLGGSAYTLAKGLALPFVRRDVTRDGSYQMSFPVSAYAPWATDAAFQAVYSRIRQHTLVDELRCYELWSLVSELRDVPGAMVEVGVWRGGTGALLAARARQLGIEDPVYLCDTWTGVVKTSGADPYYHDGKHSDATRVGVEQLLASFDLRRVELLQGIFPEETARAAEGHVFRLCHIDVDVYQSAADVFAWVWPRLSPGGVVVFDDYGGAATPGVARFVDSLRGHADRLVLHNVNGHGLVIKRG